MKNLGTVLAGGMMLWGFALAMNLESTARKTNALAVLGLACSASDNAPRGVAGNQDAPPQPFQDFATRCRAAGVLVCQGFDDGAVLRPAKWPGSGLYPGWDNTFRGSFDEAVKASGRGSLRFDIPGHSAGNAAGYWRQSFGKNFGEGSTFYVQFRQRFSKEMLKNKWGDTTWKQAIFHHGGATCADVELTTVQFYQAGFPTMYTACGARSLFSNHGDPPTLLEQGDYNCWYGHINAKDCFIYPADEWVTFYYQISIGHWGRPDSSINAWVATDGKPYRQWIKMSKFVLDNEHPGNDYDALTLLTYMTGKNEAIDHPIAHTWYDELIVSEQPIAAPTATSAPSPSR